MKARTYVSIMILVLAVLIVVGSCATDKMAYISKDYEIYGTWINPDAKPIVQKAKIVIHPNGKMELYPTITSASFGHNEFVITNKWIDSKGNIWYTLIFDWGELYQQDTFDPDYVLCKISDSGKTLELSWTNTDYLKEIDPNYTDYHILYRQE